MAEHAKRNAVDNAYRLDTTQRALLRAMGDWERRTSNAMSEHTGGRRVHQSLVNRGYLQLADDAYPLRWQITPDGIQAVEILDTPTHQNAPDPG